MTLSWRRPLMTYWERSGRLQVQRVTVGFLSNNLCNERDFDVRTFLKLIRE